MKETATLLIGILGVFLGACAPGDHPVRDVGTQFEEGITGHGRLVPIDQPDDPYIR